MANTLTDSGRERMLKITGGGWGAGNGGIAFAATKIILMHSSSTPNGSPADPTYGAIATSGLDFFEVANGNGYTTGGHAIDESDWTYDAANKQIVLANQVWTAASGAIAGILGAFIADADDLVLAYWEKSSPETLPDGETYTLSSLTIKIA